jgi:hypothetical protein
MIILTKEEAELVHGKTSDHTALEPVLLDDGVTWVLPDEVLDDPAHAVVHKFLRKKQKRQVEASEWRKDDDKPPKDRLTEKPKGKRVEDPDKKEKARG